MLKPTNSEASLEFIEPAHLESSLLVIPELPDE